MEVRTHLICICICFRHVCRLKVGAPPKAVRPILWRWPKAASIVGDGEAANIAKTYAYTYQMCPYFHICHLSYYLQYVGKILGRYWKAPGPYQEDPGLQVSWPGRIRITGSLFWFTR